MVVRALVAMATVLALAGPLVSELARAQDEDNTPDVADFVEGRNYTFAATREVLTQWSFVVGEVDRHPGEPTKADMKSSFLRKRVLDLRLVMDLNAYAFQPSALQRYRDLVDQAYETIGAYKDLFDVQDIDGQPIDQREHDDRLNAMNNAVAPFRQADVRHKFEKAIDNYEKQLISLDKDQTPRLWQIAQLQPTDSLDSAGNMARLGTAVLINLRDSGLLVEDIVDPQQEAQFHDVRKALRSVLVLTDMFPSVTGAVAEVRQPLADLVKAYGKTNDQFTAFHEAQLRGGDVAARAEGVRKSYTKVVDAANEFAGSGQLDAFVAALEFAQASHQR